MKIKTTKPYIIEGEIIPKGTEITTLKNMKILVKRTQT